MYEKQKLINIIQDGAFTCLIKHSNKKGFKQFSEYVWVCIHHKIIENIILFYKYLEKNTYTNIVYRGIHIDPTFNDTILPHPLPFSTSLSLSFVEDWLSYSEKKNTKKIILIIHLTQEHDVFPLNLVDEEQEITLSPGNIVISQYIKSVKDVIYIDCNYYPYNLSNLIQFYNDNT